MQNLQQLILKYLDFCKYQKTLNEKSLKAYRIDLTQYANYMSNTDMQLNRGNLAILLYIFPRYTNSMNPKAQNERLQV